MGLDGASLRRNRQPSEGFLMKFRPDLGTGMKDQQPHRFTAVTQRQHKQAGTAEFAAAGVAHHGARSVIHLAFFPGCSFDHRAGFRRRLATETNDEPLDTLIATGEAAAITRSCQIPLALRPFESSNSMVSRCGSQALRPADALAVAAGGDANTAPESGITSARLAGFAGWGSGVTSLAGFAGALRPQPPGGRRPMPAARKIISGGFSADTGGLLNLAQRPTEPPKCYDLLLLFLVQDIAHIDRG